MAESISELFGNPGDPVPTVDPADLATVWRVGQEAEAHAREIGLKPGQTIGVGMEVYKAACQPGADVRAAWFRFTMTQALGLMEHQELAHLDQNEQLRDAVFKVAARFPMRWVGEGRLDGLPYDAEAFVREVRKEQR